ncbi:FlgB family protein [Thalassovita sp.]|uniref:FlgB family protein n=1 Tax=Thalassovita sp. TaxID=1979401 RepID=UPI0029DE8D88|nr:FlgB family protein [Thalassovita sp.]
MFQNLDIFRIAQSMAVHAGRRQAVIAQNIANADTPGYKPQDLAAFSDLLRQSEPGGTMGRRDLAATVSGMEPQTVRGAAESPNGNGVSLEQEMVKSVDARRQHDQALAIYKSALTIMRSTLGRR